MNISIVKFRHLTFDIGRGEPRQHELNGRQERRDESKDRRCEHAAVLAGDTGRESTKSSDQGHDAEMDGFQGFTS